MKHLIALAFIVICLSSCSLLNKKPEYSVEQVEFIKGCIVSTSMILGGADQNDILQGCAQIEHEYRQYEKQAKKEAEEPEVIRRPLGRSEFMKGPVI
jgi:hypothetical protein